MRGCVTEERNSGDYSAEREIRKNRREKENHLGWREDLGNAWGDAEMHKYDGSEMRGRERVREGMFGERK